LRVTTLFFVSTSICEALTVGSAASLLLTFVVIPASDCAHATAKAAAATNASTPVIFLNISLLLVSLSGRGKSAAQGLASSFGAPVPPLPLRKGNRGDRAATAGPSRVRSAPGFSPAPPPLASRAGAGTAPSRLELLNQCRGRSAP